MDAPAPWTLRGHAYVCALAMPDALFAAARAEGCELDLELECMRCAVRAWATTGSTM